MQEVGDWVFSFINIDISLLVSIIVFEILTVYLNLKQNCRFSCLTELQILTPSLSHLIKTSGFINSYTFLAHCWMWIEYRCGDGWG